MTDFERLIREHADRMCAVAYAVVRDRARSEEIVQDALILAWQRREAMPAHAAAWLCTIARNLARNANRRATTVPLAHEVPADGDPRDTLIASEESERIEAALAELDDDDREALVLHYRCDQSMAAVADTLAISEVAARKRVQRGRDRLRDRLAGVEGVLARTRPAVGFGAACVAMWLAARSAEAATTGASAAGAGPAIAAAPRSILGRAALAIGTVALAGAGLAVAVQARGDTREAFAAPPAPTVERAEPASTPTKRKPSTRANALAPDAPATAPTGTTGHSAPRDGRADLAPPAPDLVSGVLGTIPHDVSPRDQRPDRLIDIDFSEAPADQLLEILSQLAEVPILIDGADLSYSTNARFEKTPMSTVIDEVLAQSDAARTDVTGVRMFPGRGGCAAALGGDAIELTVIAAPLSQVAATLADHLHAPILVPFDDRDRPITVHLTGTAGEALDQLVDAAGMGCEQTPGFVIHPRG